MPRCRDDRDLSGNYRVVTAQAKIGIRKSFEKMKVARRRMGKHTERRKHPRFQVENVAVATLGKSKVGIITEISKGGLAFRYIGFDQVEEEVFKGSQKVSIVHEGTGFSLLDVLCTMIRNYSTLHEYYQSSLRMNRCCLQFGWLSPAQKSQLDNFIYHFTESV